LITRRTLLGSAAACPLAGSAGLSLSLLSPLTARGQQAAEITVTEVSGLTLLAGAGCNVVALAGDDGALMIDGGLAANAEALLSAVFNATGNDRIDTLINTHWHPEQTGANELVGRAGGTIFAHENTRMYLSNTVYSSAILDDRLEALPEPGRPTETTRGEGTRTFASTRIDYGYLPAAHTDGDLFLHFPQQNVLVAGGVVSAEHWPLLDYLNGAWYGGRVRALQRLADLVEPDTVVVPADGRTLTGREIVRQRDVYLELFETMIGYMNRGFGPEDAAANNPLATYEAEYGDAFEFIYGAYRSMLIAYVPE